MRIAILQFNPTIGDVQKSMAAIVSAHARAAEMKADLLVTPELSLCGYPPRDLLYRAELHDAIEEAISQLCQSTVDGPAILLGTPLRSLIRDGKPLHNGAILLEGGEISAKRYKQLLPTYDVFDEARYFEPAAANNVIRFRGCRIGVTICEDLWNDRDLWPERLYEPDPVELLAAERPDVMINISASPYQLGKGDVRERMLTHAAKKYRVPFIYCNQVGADDELLFDGQSLVTNAEGDIVARGALFEEDFIVVDTNDLPAPIGPAETCIEEAAHRALVLGVRDYFRKTGFKRAVLGLSGGIDSALTAAIAVDALGAENVVGITMPSRYSSGGSVSDSEELAERLGIQLFNIPIEPAFSSMLQMLAPVLGDGPPDVTEENLQARARAVVLMAYANRHSALVLTTGNKSELAVGYCTLYGDMCGALGVIADVPKMLVYAIARWLNRDSVRIPVATITKPPSAELAPGQVDQDSLPPYEILDQIVERYVEYEESIDVMVEAGLDRDSVECVVRLININEYKRRQAAPGLRITSKAFGVGRRYPIAARHVALARPGKTT